MSNYFLTGTLQRSQKFTESRTVMGYEDSQVFNLAIYGDLAKNISFVVAECQQIK